MMKAAIGGAPVAAASGGHRISPSEALVRVKARSVRASRNRHCIAYQVSQTERESVDAGRAASLLSSLVKVRQRARIGLAVLG
jgi:hypothetical protein